MLSTMMPEQLNVSTILQYGATVHKDAVVTTWTDSGPRKISFGEIGQRTAQLANALRSLGIDGDQRVATFQWNNSEHMEAYLAIPSMGAVLHPLNIRLFPDQLEFVANHAEDKVVIVDPTLIPLLQPLLPKFSTVEHVIVTGGAAASLEAPEGVQVHDYEELLAAQPTEFEWPEVDENSGAAMCYTSGTTGDPKGVVYSHRSIYLHSMQICMSDGMNISLDDYALAIVPMFHAMSWGLPYASFMVGASLLMPERFLQPEPLAAMIASEKPTLAAAVPTIWQAVDAYSVDHPVDMSSFRSVVVGGSSCPPELIRKFRDKYGINITHAWGMTETSPIGTLSRPKADLPEEKQFELRQTQGRLLGGVKARIVDDAGSALPWDGESVGELEVRGPWITGSYYKVDASNSFDDGWLRTGDVGYITPEGFLQLTDRAKDIIKSGGEWISSVEVENYLLEHPSVAEAAVIGVPDPKWDERPLATVVIKEGLPDPDVEELRAHLAERMAKWQVPERFAFVDEIPKTSVGKLDKKRIRSSHADGELTVVNALEK
ncbi:fatty-acyl-CoA synthase [Dietzia sp. NCCP-2495]|uniref:long-chain fatty acid--CoA ligase n=1 Tax=Dietzia sp. NCCP-2495 TaxID=2934675 RepID=UPI0022311481|nr:long-chain fatty acid--CoA ligase [Dietzia sp. NCCP-2495]GLB64813.1 fatty-acyl-CoA synthase [Dietzia sp. NCCP-2495]